MEKNAIVVYHSDYVIDPKVAAKIAQKGDNVRYANANYFKPRELERASLVVLALETEASKAIAAAYGKVPVVSLDDYLSGKAKTKSGDAEAGFDPDAPLNGGSEPAKVKPKKQS